MIAVLEANSSKLEAVKTTASLRPRPPTIMPNCDMNLSLSVALKCSGKRPMDRAVRTGAVMTMVTITAVMAQRVVRRRGNFIVGLNWLMLSKPENASQAEENPTSSS